MFKQLLTKVRITKGDIRHVSFRLLKEVFQPVLDLIELKKPQVAKQFSSIKSVVHNEGEQRMAH